MRMLNAIFNMAAPCGVESTYWDIFEQFQRDFDNFVLLKNPERRRSQGRKVVPLHKVTKSLGCGDFKSPGALLKEALTTPPPPRSSLEPSTTNSEVLNSFCEDIVTSSKTWTLEVSSCDVAAHPDSAVYLKLHRTKTLQKVLHRVVCDGDQYGRVPENPGLAYLIRNCSSADDESCHKFTLANLRAWFLCEHIGCLLNANGFKTIFKSNIPVEQIESTLKDFGVDCDREKFLDESDLNEVQSDAVEKVKKSKYMHCDHCASGVSKRLPRTTGNDDANNEEEEEEESNDAKRTDMRGDIFLQIRQFLCDSSKNIGKNGYDQNIQNVQVLNSDGTATKTLENCARLQKHIADTCRKSTEKLHVLHVVNYEKSFVQQQVDVVWQTLYGDDEKGVSQTHCVCGPVTARKTDTVTPLMDADDFLRLRRTQMREAWVMKYGNAVSGEGWEDTISAMTVAAIKFELLSTTARNPVKVDLSQGGTSANNKGGSFVIYNFARLSTLFAHYRQAVEQGIYPDLPDVAEIDYTLLREEEEWELLLHYILPYPSLVKECISEGEAGSPHAKIHTHKICHFLTNLSRDFSAYYGRVHVLTEARPHLLPTIFARLTFLKCIQQVMKNALSLLNITPLQQV